MGQVLHGSATTTEAVRRAIQHSQESLRALAKRYGINQKTVAKWKKRGRRSPICRLARREPKSTVLSIEEEAVIVAFRQHTLLPLDDCLYALQPTIPHLTRSSLHRCLQRHGISRLPRGRRRQAGQEEVQGLPDRLLPHRHRRSPDRRRQALSLRGNRPDIKFAFVELHEKATREMAAADFLRHLIAAVPYTIHTVLTDNGIQFTTPGEQPLSRARYQAHWTRRTIRAHAFELPAHATISSIA